MSAQNIGSGCSFVSCHLICCQLVCVAKLIEYSIPAFLLQGLQHTPCCTAAGCCITGSTSFGSDGTDGQRGPQDVPAFSSPRCLRRPIQTATNPGGKYVML